MTRFDYLVVAYGSDGWEIVNPGTTAEREALSSPDGTRWENRDWIADVLARFGAEGWELVTTRPLGTDDFPDTYFVFKRAGSEWMPRRSE